MTPTSRPSTAHGTWWIPLGREKPLTKPARTIEVMDEGDKPKTRRGRPRKTGRPEA